MLRHTYCYLDFQEAKWHLAYSQWKECQQTCERADELATLCAVLLCEEKGTIPFAIKL